VEFHLNRSTRDWHHCCTVYNMPWGTIENRVL